MDIICAKCGKHFSSIEAAREHRGHCKASNTDEELHWLPAKKSARDKWVPTSERKLTLSELEKLRELEESLKPYSISKPNIIKKVFPLSPIRHTGR